MILTKIKEIITSEHPHFIYIDYKTYKRYKYILKFLIFLNKNYKNVEIFRKKYKHHDKIVVIALKDYGKNVKRRTNGYAKDWVDNHPGSTCLYCGTPLNKSNCTADHILPVSKGGGNSKVNLIVCCRKCNGDRGDQDFYAYLKDKNKGWDGDKFI